MKKWLQKTSAAVLLLALILVGTVLLAVRLGSVEMSSAAFLGGLFRRPGYETFTLILYQLRLPRVLGAILAGAGLSLSGLLLQNVTGNDLAGPNIIGVNAGAGFAVILLLFTGSVGVYWTPVAAFFGAFLTTLLILYTAVKVNGSKTTVILAGIAVTAVLNAGISFLSMLDSDVLVTYNHFSIGGLTAVRMEQLIVPGVIIGASLSAAMLFGKRINVLCLGDALAASLGVNVGRMRLFALVLASASAAAVVSFAGLLGFVGLVVPHICRRVWGGEFGRLLPLTVLFGAILVLSADLAGRLLFAPSEIPVGIVMALIGGPFFFSLLLRRKQAYDEI